MQAIKLLKGVGVVVSTTASHYINGPPRPSWPLSLTLAMALMKADSLGEAPHSSGDSTAADGSSEEQQQQQQQQQQEQQQQESEREAFFRRITPGTPENAEFRANYQAIEDSVIRFAGPNEREYTVCQTSIAISTRGLKGILADADAKATDVNFNIPAEWIRATDVQAADAESAHDGPARQGERIVLYSHGGAFIRFSPRSHRGITLQISKQAGGVRVLSLEYRLAPEHPFPSALHDVVSAYLALVDPNGKYKFDPSNVIVAGDSAGGNLSLALLLYLRDHGLPLPAGGFLLSPAMDLNCETDAWQRNTPYDYLRFPSRKDPYHAARLYTDPKARNWDEVQHIVNSPYVSPIKAESLQGLPHLLIQYGQCELLRDDIYNFSQRIINEVGPEKLQSEEYDDMIHVFHSFGSLKQTKDAYASFGKWASKLFSESA